MTNKVIVDSNIMVGFFDGKDIHHKASEEIFGELERLKVEVCYLDCVVNEVFSVICRRYIERNRAEELPGVLKRLMDKFPAEALVWSYREAEKLYQEILVLMTLHKGRINFHDSLIALIAREYGLNYIVSFDPDFDEIGWIKRVKVGRELKDLVL